MVAEADDRRLLVAMLAATGWLAGTRGVAARDDPFLFDGNALLRRTGSVMAARVDPGFISTDVGAGLTLDSGAATRFAAPRFASSPGSTPRVDSLFIFSWHLGVRQPARSCD